VFATLNGDSRKYGLVFRQESQSRQGVTFRCAMPRTKGHEKKPKYALGEPDPEHSSEDEGDEHRCRMRLRLNRTIENRFSFTKEASILTHDHKTEFYEPLLLLQEEEPPSAPDFGAVIRGMAERLSNSAGTPEECLFVYIFLRRLTHIVES
jgi:hypothetical protein